MSKDSLAPKTLGDDVMKDMSAVDHKPRCDNCVYWNGWGLSYPGWGRCRSALSRKSGDDTRAGYKCKTFAPTKAGG